jgi:hypothetical protein
MFFECRDVGLLCHSSPSLHTSVKPADLTSAAKQSSMLSAMAIVAAI